MTETSLYRIVSKGVVAENKKAGIDYVEVAPLETLPMMDGELSQKSEDYSSEGSDSDGVAYAEATTTTATLRCKWRGIGQSNRMTSPDVRRGEEVLIYQFADSDEYFWDTFNNHLGIRKLEKVVHSYSGTKDESVTDPDETNSYVFTIDTRNKSLSITTSKADGEPFTYSIELNTKEGSFKLTDDIGNHIYLHSQDKHIRLENASGSKFELIDKVSNWIVPDTINIQTTTYNLTTSNINTKGEISQSGNTTHSGNISTSGNHDISGSVTSGGNMSSGGSMGAAGGVTAGGGSTSLQEHRHQANGEHGVTSPPI